MIETVQLLRPTGPALVPAAAAAPTLDRAWATARVALVDNSKPGAVPLLDGIADGLGIPAERRDVIAKQIAPGPMNDEELARVKQCRAAILAVGNCGGCTSWTTKDAVTVAVDLGIPSVLIVTTPFELIASQVATSLGHPGLPIVAVEHPVGLLPYEVVHERGFGAAARVRDALEAAATGPTTAAEAGDDELLAVRGDELDDVFMANGWSDGLPLVAPTPERVAAMLGRHRERADEVIGGVATGYGLATYRAVAVNAVLAGCRPAYFDVLVAAVRGVTDPAFNLHGIQATTHPAGPTVLVNGPVAERIGMNSGACVFGPGNRANATIGRALRLVLQNVGRSRPGETDRATFGHPGKYTQCIAENERDSPWEPFHVSRGFTSGTSAVTVLGTEAPQNMNDVASTTPEGLLKTIIGSMSSTGHNHHQYPRTQPFVIHSPEHAQLLAAAGFSRRAVQEYLFEHARVPIAAFSDEKVARFLARRRPAWFGQDNTSGVAALADDPDDILIAVAGGPGTHSVFLPSFGPTLGVTTPLDE